MSDINMEGNVVEDIFMGAINSMPQGASAIAKMIASNKRRKPLNNQQLFKKTMKAMKNMNVGKEEDILKCATRAYLQKNFGLPACDTSAYDVKIRRGKITLKYNPSSSGAVPFGFWMNKHSYDGKTISESEQARVYTKLTPDEITSKLTENSKWLEQKDVYKQRVAEMFGVENDKLTEIFKDDMPGRADFSGCDISNFDFSKFDLSGANFKGARLNGCIITKMENANLTDAAIDGCIFSGANLAASDFSKAAISNTTFDKANLRSCNFGQSVPHDVTFREAVFKDTNLDFVQPKNIVFDSENSSTAAIKQTAKGKEPGKTKPAHKAATQNKDKPALTTDKKKGSRKQEALPGDNASATGNKPRGKAVAGQSEVGNAAVETAATQAKIPAKAPAKTRQPVGQSINM